MSNHPTHDLLSTIGTTLGPLFFTVRHWLQHYGLWVLALGLFGDTFLFTGIVVPGFTLLVATGFLIADGTFSLHQVLLFAWVGAICGDQGGYWLGYWWGERLLRKRQEMAARINTLLEHESYWLLLLYHYVPYFRTAFPAVVGSAHFHYFRWLIFDSIGILIWVVAILSVGYTAHGAWAHGNMLTRLLNAAVFLLVIFIIWRVYRDVSGRGRKK